MQKQNHQLKSRIMKQMHDLGCYSNWSQMSIMISIYNYKYIVTSHNRVLNITITSTDDQMILCLKLEELKNSRNITTCWRTEEMKNWRNDVSILHYGRNEEMVCLYCRTEEMKKWRNGISMLQNWRTEEMKKSIYLTTKFLWQHHILIPSSG